MSVPRVSKPRLAFLGVGWIGRHRMQAVIESGLAEICGIADASPEVRAAAAELAPQARSVADLDELLALRPDGLVIATPSALHAGQARRALERGVAVFCQKPLGRNAVETLSVVRTAEQSDRLLGVDFSYRKTQALESVKALLDSGDLGSIFAARLVFHNAYGPDKRWYYDRALSGGGCVMDLGTHLVDAVFWLLRGPQIRGIRSRLYARGELLSLPAREIEDYAIVQLELASGCLVEIACSWKLSAGCDAEIRADLYGPRGGAVFRNLDGSFYDFCAEHLQGTSRRLLSTAPDAWGGRAIVDWVRRLQRGERFDPRAFEIVDVARVLDAIYGLR